MRLNGITYNCIVSACLSRVTSDRLGGRHGEQAGGVITENCTMSIGLNALKRHGSHIEAQCILALLDASGIKKSAPRRCS